MAAEYGRKVTLLWNGAVIPGVREKGLTISGEAVNVTSDEDDGVQRLLAEDAEAAHAISLSGVTKSYLLRQAKASGVVQGDVVMTYPDGYEISGTFNLGEYSEGLPYNDAITFECALLSTGDVIHTPPST